MFVVMYWFFTALMLLTTPLQQSQVPPFYNLDLGKRGR